MSEGQGSGAKKILLCGDRSFVARGLIEVLQRDGHEVITFSRGPEKREGNRATGNVDRMSDNPHLNEPFDVVLNYILLKDDPIEANDRFLQSILDFCKSRGVKHLVHISSVSVYSGDVTRVVEDAQVETVPENKGSYGSRKVAQDLYLNKNAPADLRISYVRPGFVLAPGLMDPTIGMGLRMGFNKLLLIGSTQNQLPVVTRDQVHEAVAKVVNSEEKAKREAFLVLDTNSPSRESWLTACCERLGCGAKVISFPTPLWRLAGFGGGIVAKLAGMSMKPGLIIKNACRRQEFDSSGTQRRLGMSMSVDWRKELVDSFNDQASPKMPYASIPWRRIEEVKRITFLGYGQVVMQKHMPALKRLGYQGETIAFDIKAGVAKDGQAIKAIGSEPLPPSDLLVLASPGPVHIKAIETLKQLDAPLLIEKPLCYSKDELEQWSQFAAGRKSPSVVCQNFRFKSNVERMMKHLARYTPGKLLHVDISFQSPSIGKEWRTWTRDERRARTLLMDYSVHYLDVACMFATDGWKLAHSRYELDHMGFTSLIEGRFDSPHYPVNFVLRQGLMPRRARIRLTFQNYLVSLGFFPDTFVAYMADDGAGLYGAEKKEAGRATRAKIIDKLTSRDSDTSHAAAYLAALARDDFAKPLSIDSLRSYYSAVFELADAVYGPWQSMQTLMQTETYKFKNPHTLGNKLARILWSIVWRLLFRPSPWFMRSWRRMLLKMFGAKLGNAEFNSSVEIWAPWLLEAGDHVFVDRDVKLYNAYGITIGDRVVISQGVFLCTPSHDHTITTFPLIGKKITIGNDTWLAAEAFVGPGVTVGEGAVVAARSVVVKDVAPWTVVGGNPAKLIKPRELRKPE